MAKRKFNVTRLYRLFRFLVIAISILSGISAYLNYRTFMHADKEVGRLTQERNILRQGEKSDTRYLLLLAMEREGRLTDSQKKEIEQYRKQDALKWEIDMYSSISETMGNRFFICLSIAIGLPIIFFGGVGIYRYLFPVLKEG